MADATDSSQRRYNLYYSFQVLLNEAFQLGPTRAGKGDAPGSVRVEGRAEGELGGSEGPCCTESSPLVLAARICHSWQKRGGSESLSMPTAFTGEV